MARSMDVHPDDCSSPLGERELKQNLSQQQPDRKSRSPLGERELKPHLISNSKFREGRSPLGERELKRFRWGRP